LNLHCKVVYRSKCGIVLRYRIICTDVTLEPQTRSWKRRGWEEYRDSINRSLDCDGPARRSMSGVFWLIIANRIYDI